MATSSSDSTPFVDPEKVISYKFPETTFSYTERDAAEYALGIGACGMDPLDQDELKYVYHKDGQEFVKVHMICRMASLSTNLVLPTFGAHFPYKNEQGIADVHGLRFDPSLLLHGQQYMEIYRPLPTRSCVQNKVKIAGLHDKGKATIIEVETTSYDKQSGEPLCMNRSTIFLRGVSGFSKSNQLYSYIDYPVNQVSPVRIPKSEPSKIYEDATQTSQALLYRLSGDYNPLHADPKFASTAGFNRPILHGLCTYGFAVRAVIKCFCSGEPSTVKSIFGRFLLHVFPGETLITEMWLEGSRVIYQTSVKERGRPVLSGYVVLNHIPSSL